jgi:hypothetical protein
MSFPKGHWGRCVLRENDMALMQFWNKDVLQDMESDLKVIWSSLNDDGDGLVQS